MHRIQAELKSVALQANVANHLFVWLQIGILIVLYGDLRLLSTTGDFAWHMARRTRNATPWRQLTGEFLLP